MRKRGMVTVEMALMLPLLVLFIFGILEYGWMFTKAHQITNAARHGARIAAMPDATAAEVTAEVSALMTKAGLAGKYTLAVAPSDITALDPGETLQVTVSATYSNISLTQMPLIPTPASLAAAVTMAKEGP